jgi:hypothetical protein
VNKGEKPERVLQTPYTQGVFFGRADENDGGGGGSTWIKGMQVAELKKKSGAQTVYVDGAVRNGGSLVDARNAAVNDNGTGETKYRR